MNSTPLRPAKSQHSLRKPKAQRPVLILNQPDYVIHETVNFIGNRDVTTPIYNRLNRSPTSREHVKIREQRSEPAKRDTILIDLTNSDVLPALDYALAMLDTEQRDASSLDADSSFSCSPQTSPTPSIRTPNSPPRYGFAPIPWKGPPSPHRVHLSACHARHPTVATCPLDPQEFAHVFSQTRSSRDPRRVEDIPPSIPFPSSPSSTSSSRVPLLQRKPRLGQLGSETVSLDMHDPFMFGNPSKVSLVRSISALDRHRDRAPYKSTTSVNTVESSWSTLLTRRPVLRSPSLKFFSSPGKKFRLGALNRNGSITASNAAFLKKPLSNIRTAPSSDSFCDLDDPFRC